MIYTTSNVVASTGTPARLSSERTPATWVLVQAVTDNTDVIYVGGVNPASTQTTLISASGLVGIPLIAGASMFFPAAQTTSPYDLHEMWFVGTTGDKVSITYLRR